MTEKYCYNKFFNDFFWGREEKTKEWSNLNFFQNFPFWTYIIHTSTFIFWCMIIPLDPHSVTPSEGPKGFYFLLLIIFKNKLDYVKRPSSMV